MQNVVITKPYRFVAPHRSKLWWHLFRPLLPLYLRKCHGIVSVETRGVERLRASLDAVVAWQPDLILVSAGFDAYARDPITAMTLERDDFATLGRWLAEIRARHAIPAAAVLEGGYSDDLPLLVEAFLFAWDNQP